MPVSELSDYNTVSTAFNEYIKSQQMHQDVATEERADHDYNVISTLEKSLRPITENNVGVCVEGGLIRLVRKIKFSYDNWDPDLLNYRLRTMPSLEINRVYSTN